MAVIQQQGGFASSGSAWSLPIPASTGSIHRSIWFVLPLAARPELPAGYSPYVEAVGAAVRIVGYQQSIAANAPSTVLSVTIRNATTNVVMAADGVCAYLQTNKLPHVYNNGGSASYVSTHQSPPMTATYAENLAVSIIACEYPRTWTTSDVTEQFDLRAPLGPSMAFGTAQPGIGVTGPYTWTPTDAYTPTASGDDRYVSVSLLFDDYGTVVTPPPVGSVNITQVGDEINIVEVDHIEWSAPATWTSGTPVLITAVVTGDDLLPFAGMPVTISVSGMTTASTNLVADVDGRITLFATPVGQGVKTVTGTAAGFTSSISRTITNQQSVTLSSMQSGVTQGQTITLSGRAINTAGLPVADGFVAWQVSGVAFEDVSTLYSQTDAQGNFTRTIRTTGFGTLTASVAVNGVSSNTVSVTVAEYVVVQPPPKVVTTIRVRGVVYNRIKAANDVYADDTDDGDGVIVRPQPSGVAITSHANLATLSGSSSTFTWTGLNVDQWQLLIGTTPGAGNVFSGAVGADRSVTVNGLPVNGSALHATLKYRQGSGEWQNIAISLTAFTAPARPLPSGVLMTSPALNSTFASSSQAFTWTGTEVDEYQFLVGTDAGLGDIYTGAVSSAVTATVTGLPTDGSLVHTTIRYRQTGDLQWVTMSNIYTAYTAPVVRPAPSAVQIISPAAGATLTGTEETIYWSGTEVDEWWLYVGTSSGGKQILDTGSVGSATSAIVTGLPVNGSTLYVKLWYRQTGGAWLSITTTYVADSPPVVLPAQPLILSVSGDDLVDGQESAEPATVIGSAPAGAVVTATWGVTTHTATATSGGSWSIDFAPGEIPEGPSVISAYATLGGLSSATTLFTVSVDRIPPALPVISVIAGNDVVSVVEAASPIVISGTAEAASTVRVLWSGVERITTASSGGAWSVSYATPPAVGASSVVVTATDAAGNSSQAASRPVTVETPVVGAYPVAANSPTITTTPNALNTVTPVVWSSSTPIVNKEFYLKVGAAVARIPDNLTSLTPTGVSGGIVSAEDSNGYRTVSRNAAGAGSVEWKFSTTAMNRGSGRITLRASGTTTAATLGIWTGSSWVQGGGGGNLAEIVSGPGTLSQVGTQALWTIAGLSTTVDTVIRWRALGSSSASMRVLAENAFLSIPNASVLVGRDIFSTGMTTGETWPRDVRRNAAGDVIALSLTSAEVTAGVSLEARATNATGRTKRTSAGVNTETPIEQVDKFFLMSELNYIDRPYPIIPKGAINSVPIYQDNFGYAQALYNNYPGVVPTAQYPIIAALIESYGSPITNLDDESRWYWPWVDFDNGLTFGVPPGSTVGGANGGHPQGQSHHQNVRQWTIHTHNINLRLPANRRGRLAMYSMVFGANMYGYAGIAPWNTPADLTRCEDSLLIPYTFVDIDGNTVTKSFLDVHYGLRPTIYYRWDDELAVGGSNAHEVYWKPAVINMMSRLKNLLHRHWVSKQGTSEAYAKPKPLIPYAWLQYADQVPLPKRHDFLPATLTQDCLNTIKSAGADGVVLWGAQIGTDGATAQQHIDSFTGSTAYTGLLAFAAQHDLHIPSLAP